MTKSKIEREITSSLYVNNGITVSLSLSLLGDLCVSLLNSLIEFYE